MASTMMSFPLTLGAILRRAAQWFPRVDLADGQGRHTNYRQLALRACGLAHFLRAAGLQPSDRVATLLWNRLEHLEAWFGVPLAGGIVHPLNLRLHPRQLKAIAHQAGDRFVIVEPELLPLWNEIGVADQIKTVLVAPDDWSASADLNALDAWDATDENQGAAMGYTSGTTGEPKGVIYSHRALALHALAISLPDALNFRQEDCVLPFVPMFHANAWGVPHAATMLGCRQILAGSDFSAEHVLDLLQQFQVTRSAGVPLIWQRVMEALDQHPGRWRLHPGLRVNLGGAPASVALYKQFDRHGIAVHMGWGMTEMTPVGAMNPLLTGDGTPQGEERRTRQGRPLPFIEARRAGNGELEVRGPWVTDHYHGQDRSLGDWFSTGDVVTIDDHGLIGIVDRNKDLIRSGGEWISSVALENALATHPAIREAAVIAVPHPQWQERPCAIVVLREGCVADPAAWRGHLEATFPHWQCPDDYLVVDELPHTSTGKLDKRTLRARFAAPGAAAGN